MNREKYYQRRENNQWEPYTTITRNNNAELYQNYRQKSDLTVPQAWDKMREFWSGIIQEVEQEYSELKANGGVE